MSRKFRDAGAVPSEATRGRDGSSPAAMPPAILCIPSRDDSAALSMVYYLSGILLRECAMEPFTLVLVVGWLLLMGAFGGMYVIDQKVKEAKSKAAGK